MKMEMSILIGRRRNYEKLQKHLVVEHQNPIMLVIIMEIFHLLDLVKFLSNLQN